ncbi:multidrug resistance protein MdtA precursor [mine drainage metagenome]|uniref:Multidrug resistance protein MdtA n=1 Tax=mine drainage metagenome TaxID=410659 RepID=A0A1J5STG4_9ZZZZ
MQKFVQLVILSLSILLISCNAQEPSEDKKAPKATLVTVTTVKNKLMEVTEKTVGSLEGLIDPTIAAEVAARVIKVHVTPGQTVKKGQLIATLDATDFAMQRNEAQAEVAQIQAQLDNQTKTVARNQALVYKKFISQNAVDTDAAQQNVLKEQLEGAKARVSNIDHSSSKTKIYAPTNGVVEKKIVDTGEFVRIGDPIVQIISKQRLRAHLPFPEQIGALLKPGLKVRLNTPINAKTVETVIHELKPMITEGNRSIDVIADVVNEPGWQPGASVTGTVILGAEPAAMMVPEQSVILRPAGDVVYIVRNNTAYQAIVKTGLRQDGMVELLAGVKANDTVVVDGAGFLTDNTPVKVATDTTKSSTNKSSINHSNIKKNSTTAIKS